MDRGRPVPCPGSNSTAVGGPQRSWQGAPTNATYGGFAGGATPPGPRDPPGCFRGRTLARTIHEAPAGSARARGAATMRAGGPAPRACRRTRRGTPRSRNAVAVLQIVLAGGGSRRVRAGPRGAAPGGALRRFRRLAAPRPKPSIHPTHPSGGAGALAPRGSPLHSVAGRPGSIDHPGERAAAHQGLDAEMVPPDGGRTSPEGNPGRYQGELTCDFVRGSS